MEALMKRFTSADKTLTCLRQLSSLEPDGNSLLCFLDKARLIAIAGNINDDVLIATLMLSLPQKMAGHLTAARCGRSLTWDLLYDLCKSLDECSGYVQREAIPLVASINASSSTKTDKFFSSFCFRRNHSTDFCFLLKERNKKRNQRNSPNDKQRKSYAIDTDEEIKTQEIYLCFSTGKGAPSATISTKNKELKVLLDSGAEVTLLRASTATQLDITLEKTSVKLRSADGGLLKVAGIAKKVPILVEQETFFHDFIVVYDLGYEGILGSDFFSKNNVSLEFGTGISELKHSSTYTHSHSIETGDSPLLLLDYTESGPM